MQHVHSKTVRLCVSAQWKTDMKSYKIRACDRGEWSHQWNILCVFSMMSPLCLTLHSLTCVTVALFCSVFCVGSHVKRGRLTNPLRLASVFCGLFLWNHNEATKKTNFSPLFTSSCILRVSVLCRLPLALSAPYPTPSVFNKCCF